MINYDECKQLEKLTIQIIVLYNNQESLLMKKGHKLKFEKILQSGLGNQINCAEIKKRYVIYLFWYPTCGLFLLL